MPEKALTVTPLAKKDSFANFDNDNSMNLSVAKKTEDLQDEPKLISSEQTYLINKNKSLNDFQSESRQPSNKSNFDEDNPLDLSTGTSHKSPKNKKLSLKQSSDGGWDFLEKLSKLFL